ETHDGSSRSGVRFSRPARAGRDQCRPHGPGRKEHGKRVWTALGCPHPPRGRVVTASRGACGRVRTCRRPPVGGPWTGGRACRVPGDFGAETRFDARVRGDTTTEGGPCPPLVVSPLPVGEW